MYRPPGGHISRFSHIWSSRVIVGQQKSPFLYVYDRAGPHAGASNLRAMEAANAISCTGATGGWTTTSQLADDERVHGSFKSCMRRKAMRYFYDRSTTLAGEGKAVKLSPISFDTLCKWASEWAEAHAPLELMRTMLYEHLPPLMNSDGKTRRPECRKKAILDCLNAELPTKDPPTPKGNNPWFCSRCQHRYASRNKYAKEHETSETKCIGLFQVPYSPRPPLSSMNYTVSPLNRMIEFVHADTGKVCRGVFDTMLDASYNYVIKYYEVQNGGGRLLTYQGDYRKLYLAQPKWLF